MNHGGTETQRRERIKTPWLRASVVNDSSPELDDPMPSSNRTSRTITVQALARVEGEGGLTIRTRNGQVEGVELRIYEPPRFYEAFLRGRAATEAPDITARICGICPVAYQMSAVHAIEKIYGVTMPPELRALRRLLYCGEWIESHVLHIYMLHAPDFLGDRKSVV